MPAARAGHGQDRADPAHDRPVRVHRPPDRHGGQALDAKHGTTVAGKKIEVILKDDAGTPETTRRLAQELVTNDKVAVLAGFGLTPLALATVPIATQAKVPEVVMAAATSSITEQSPFVVRAGFTLPQVTHAAR